MPGARKLEIRIVGDAKSALGMFGEVDAGSSKLAGSFASLGKQAAAGLAIVSTGVVAVGAGLFKIGASFDEAYDKIRVGTGAVGGDLDVLKDEFRKVVQDVPTDFGKASDAITVVQQKLGIAGTAAAGISEQFLELSRITKTDLSTNLQAGTDALNNWSTVTADQPRILDEMFRATQLTGISFGDLATQLADTGPVLRDLGFSIEDAIGLLGTLKAGGVDVSDVMPALSKSLASAAKDGKDAGQVFRDTFQAIEHAPDATKAAGIAMDIFGKKAGPKLAGLIREGKLSFEDLTATIQGGSDTIMQAGKDTQDFAEKWELFKNRVMVALEPLATGVFQAVGDAMDRLGPIAERLSTAFGESGLSGVWAALGPNGQKLAVVLVAVAVGVWAVVSPVSLAVVAFAALAAGLVYAYQNFDTFRTIVDKVAVAAVAFATTLRDLLAPMIDFISAHSDELKVILIALAAVIGTAVVVSITSLAIGIGAAVLAVTALTAAVIAVVQGLEWLWEKAQPVRDIFSDLASLLAGPFSSAFGVAVGLVGDVRIAIDWLFSSVQRVIDAVHTLIDLIPSIPSFGLGSDTGVASGLENKWKNRASGGPMLPGHSYVVGENHPELLTMGSMGGYVNPTVAGGGSGVTINGNVVLPGVRDVDGFMREMARRSKRNGGDLSYAGF